MCKLCSSCKENKPLELFGNRKSSKDGLRSQCKACEKAYAEKTREKKRANIKGRINRDAIFANELD